MKISMTKVNNNGPTRRDYTVTLTFKAHTWDKKVDPDLATQMGNVLRDWDEGRYPFDVEMVQEGINRVIKQAMYQACQKRADEKYGNEMLPTKDDKGEVNGSISRAYMEAQKEYDELLKDHKSGRLWLDFEPKVRIERQPTREEMNKTVLEIAESVKAHGDLERTLNMTDEELAS